MSFDRRLNLSENNQSNTTCVLWIRSYRITKEKCLCNLWMMCQTLQRHWKNS